MKKILYIVVAVILLLVGALIGLRSWTKSFSPFEEVTFKDSLSVKYCRPYKNERDIFGALIPYDKVWRTGANEATVFSTRVPLMFAGEKLEPGDYSLWTIPGPESWTVILNSETGQWGVNMKEEANRDPAKDVLQVEAAVVESNKTFEQFTIFFEEIHQEIDLIMVWDRTMVIVPMTLGE